MPPNYYAIFTTLGLQRLAEAQYTGVPLEFTHVAVGDGNGSGITPSVGMTALVHETARVTVNRVSVMPSEPTTVRVEGLIPAVTGGFTIREAGLFSEAGELIVIASYPPIYKPNPSDGVTADEYIRILLVYEAVEAIALSVDPAVIMATREYADNGDEQLADRIETLEAEALQFWLGDGSDGPVDLDGTNAYPFATKSGSVYTLTRSPMATDFRVRAGVTLKRNNNPVHCTGDYQNDATALDVCDGGDGGNAAGATPGTAGAGATPGVFLGGADGGAGGYDQTGDYGNSIPNSVGGDGGRGGTIHSGYANSLGGAAAPPEDTRGSTRTARAVMEAFIFGTHAGAPAITALAGGAGGGGGAGAAAFTVAGGGGGGGGGVSATACKNAIVNGTLRANGGKGGDGSTNIDPRGGGGAGGGAGRVGLLCGTKAGTGTIQAVGGAPGLAANPSSSGDEALAGASGQVVIIETTAAKAGPHREEGLAIFTAADEVDISFSGSWLYANATGLDGYTLEVFAPFIQPSDAYGWIGVWVEGKARGGFKIKASDKFTGEVRWRALGY